MLETAIWNDIDYGNMYEHFMRLCYADKLICFHKQFDLIPFEFPDFDIDFSWYNNEEKLALLISNFYKERPKKFTCEKTVVYNNHSITFNVHPLSPKQRMLYNEFVVSTFLQRSQWIISKLNNDFKSATDPEQFLTSQIQLLTCLQGWMSFSINKCVTKVTLRQQFLQVCIAGMNLAGTKKQIILCKRHTFVELFLIGQGIFLSDYLCTAQKLFKQCNVNLPETYALI